MIMTAITFVIFLFSLLTSAQSWVEDPKLAFYPGDLLLGGLFPIHADYDEATGLCTKINEIEGVLPLQAVVYLLDEINRQKILRFKLGLAALDTVRITQKAIPVTQRLSRICFNSHERNFLCFFHYMGAGQSKRTR